MGSRPRRVLFTGHSNGVVQIWDLSTALDLSSRGEPALLGGPTPSELVRALEQCEVIASRGSTPAPTPSLPAASFSGSAKVKAANVPLLLQLQHPNCGTTNQGMPEKEQGSFLKSNEDHQQ